MPPPASGELPLAAVRADAASCRACPLWRTATQTVFGEGDTDAELMLVGEQPGDKEDVAGRPFVGPAGAVLDDALAEAGIDRGDVYLTNAVKHFKWKARGKRRIHDKPNWGEVGACRQWLDAELELVRPRVLVPLGATAAEALLGPVVPGHARARAADRGHRVRGPRRRHDPPVGGDPDGRPRVTPGGDAGARLRPADGDQVARSAPCERFAGSALGYLMRVERKETTCCC